MADKRVSIVFDAKMEIGNIKTALEEINKITSNAAVNLPKGIGSNLTKTIQSIRSELLKLEGLQGAEPSTKNANNINKVYTNIVAKFQSLKALMGDLNKDFALDPKKFFSPDVENQIKGATQALEAYYKKLKEGPQGDQYKKDIESLTRARRDQRTAQNRQSQAELDKKETETLIQTLEKQAKAEESAAKAAKKTADEQVKKAQSIQQLIEKEKALAQIEEKRKARDAQKAIVDHTKEGSKQKVKEQIKLENMDAEIANLEKYASSVEHATAAQRDLGAEVAKAKSEAASATEEATRAEAKYQNTLQRQGRAQSKLTEQTNAYQVASQAAEKAAQDIQRLKGSVTTAEQSFKANAIAALVVELSKINIIVPQAEQNIDGINKVIRNLSSDAIKGITKALEQMGIDAKQAGINIDQLGNKNTGFKQVSTSAQRAADDISMLQSRINYFFSSINIINLFKRTVRQAINTVKELDAVMTETAVVTDFTVGDMWEKLPEYASQANALGASIKDLYAATTLYYQQGLKTEAAMSVGVETMKMARIAGLEAGDATQYMTAALRGFNMEVNEVNAQRVNDVYSELAAITAADTGQIATAMTKTASIAASANMEFETTAALLAQIIETTQEAPETAGTAMKTIIARFTEVKELFTEGQLTGEDEEGEEININRIDAALKTVGISLKDFLNGTKGIDDIFLELASKWDSLNLATQRYIATTAAGSRQQSRFIAMMSNYGRTMELVDAAQISAGASQGQFDKTLESMQAKLQKLQNAWNQFTMGLANNEILKFGVDILTGLLNTINKLTSSLSGGNGLVKSIINLATAIAALKGGASIISRLFGETQVSITGKRGNVLSLGKNNAVQQVVGNNVQQQGYVEGQKAGQGFAQGFREKLQGISTSTGYKTYSSGFLGSVIDMDAKSGKGVSNPAEYTKNKNRIAELKGIMNSNSPDAVRNFDAYEKELEELERKQWQLSGGTSALQVNFTNLGMAVMGAGTAVTLLGGLFEKVGAEEFGQKIKNLGSIFTGLGTTLMLFGPLLNKAGIAVNRLGLSFAKAGAVGAASGAATTIAWGPLLAMILPIIAALGILVGIFIALRNASPDAQLEKATEAAKQTAEAADAAAEAYDNLKSSLESIDGKKSILEELTIGTQEWKNAISELNDEILNLLAKYPELSEFVTSNKGILSISEEGEAAVLEQRYQDKIDTQAANTAAQITKQEAQQAVYFQDLDNRLKLTKTVKIQNEETEIVDREATEQLAKDLAAGRIERSDARLDFLDGIKDGYEEFLEFGRSLNASEQAIDVFINSLMNVAMTNADVSEEFKGQINGMYDTKAIDKIQQDIEKSYGVINKDKQIEYAEIMGYTRTGNMKFSDSQGNPVEVTKAQIKSQLAAIDTQNKLTQNIKALESVMPTIRKEFGTLGQAFENVVSKADGMGITLSDISENADLFKGTYKEASNGAGGFVDTNLNNLYQQVKDIWSPEEFYRIFSEAYQQAETTRAASEAKMTSMGLDMTAFDTVNIDTGSLNSIVNELYDVFLTSGKETTAELSNTLATIMNDLNPEQAQIFAEALGVIDWTKIEDIEDLDNILLQLGFDADRAGIDMNSLKEQIKNAAKATKTFDLEKMREEIKSVEELVEKIKDRKDNERSFTKKEHDLMVESNASLEDQFVATGIDEFVYVGDSIGDLILALESNTSALLGEYGKQINYNAEKSNKWQQLIDDNNIWKTDNGKGEIIGNEYNILADIAQQGSLEGYNQASVIEIMEKVGMGVDAGRALKDGYTPAQLAEIIMAEYTQYGSAQAREANLNAQTTYQTDLEQIRLSKMSGQDIINDKQGQNEDKIKALDTKIVTEGLREEYENTTKSLKEQNSALALNEKLVKASISDAKEYENKLAKLAKTYDDNKDALKKTNKGTKEYQQAITNITKAAREAFSDDITEEFVEENLSLFENWYKGAKDSADKLRKALTDSLIDTVDETTINVDSLKNIISGLDGLDFDIYGHADASQLFEELTKVMGSAKEAAAAMEVLGYSVTWEETGVKRMLMFDPESPTGKRMVDVPQYKAIVTDGLGNREGANKSSYSGGGGGGGKKEKWKNPYDKFYNVVEDINEELRTREKLERRYQALLDKTSTKASDLVKNTQDQLKSLEKEKEMREGLLEGRKHRMSDIENEYSDLSQYAWYNEEDDTIEIDWEKINALDDSKNEELTSRIEEYVGKLEEQQELIESEEEELESIEETVREIRDQGKDEYFDLENQIKESLIGERQQEIDKLSAINESINDTNSRLIDAMQSSIDKYRQDRENERTEEELSDKQRRLAYLQQDTSGANALDIMQLQEEIDQSTEDYTDTLIDQKISELQEQNDKAAEQREKQISLMQAQLDKWSESGEIWSEVYRLMEVGMDADGIKAGSELETLLKEGASFEAMSNLQKMDWLEEIENNVARAIQWLMVGNSAKTLLAAGQLKKNQTITFTTKDGQTVTGTLQEDGTIKTDTGEIYTDVYRNFDGKTFYTEENYITPTPEEPEESRQPEQEDPTPAPPKLTTNDKRGVSAAIWNGNYGWGTGGTRASRLKEVFGANDIQKNYVDKGITKGYTGSLSDYSYANMKKKFKQYKTGGLADFTGPAWLDGTKSKPEYILNAEQTKSFFELVDVLGGLKGGTSQSSQITGDSIYDVDINVESIGSDYDVEKLATTIKRMINDDARYRNNNAINLQR